MLDQESPPRLLVHGLESDIAIEGAYFFLAEVEPVDCKGHPQAGAICHRLRHRWEPARNDPRTARFSSG